MALAQGPPLPHALGAPRPLPETGRSPSPRLGAFCSFLAPTPTAPRALSPTSASHSGMFFSTPPPRKSPADQYKLRPLVTFCSN